RVEIANLSRPAPIRSLPISKLPVYFQTARMKPIACSLLTLCALLLSLTTTPAADPEDRLVLLGASYGKNVLAICDADGKVLWKYDTAGPTAPQKGHAGHHDVHLLANGNILFHDSWTKTQ